MYRVLLVLLGVFAVLASASAQQDMTTVGEAVDVQLVNVSVLVTDKDGVPVLDLEQAEFRVFEDGEPVELTHFSRPDGTIAVAAEGAERASESPEEASTIAPRLPGRYVIFWDELNTSAAYRAPAYPRNRLLRTSQSPGLARDDGARDGRSGDSQHE